MSRIGETARIAGCITIVRGVCGGYAMPPQAFPTGLLPAIPQSDPLARLVGDK
jgi:hypothetical protein